MAELLRLDENLEAELSLIIPINVILVSFLCHEFMIGILG